jgi:hypothetical protein
MLGHTTLAMVNRYVALGQADLEAQLRQQRVKATGLPATVALSSPRQGGPPTSGRSTSAR